MNYYNEIKNKLINNEIYDKAKDYSKDKHKVITYFEIGKLLYEAGSIYGEDIIGKYSEKLMIEVGKKYNRRTLYRMKQFYIMFREGKVSTLSAQLSWSHYTELLSIKNKSELYYYLTISIKQHIDVRGLREKIKNKEYERLDENTKLKLMKQEKVQVNDFVKNPILIHQHNHHESVSEKILQKLILEDIEFFMKELGNSFCFIGSEYKIRLGNNFNYIDLLLFNIEYNCYVAVELKVTELKKEHIGQIQVYMNYIDDNLRKINQNKTIGIIICKQDNKYVIKYCSDDRIIAREYELL